MFDIPTEKRELLKFTNELIEQCRVSVGMRSAYCKLMNAICETGRYDGTKALINTLYKIVDRTASHIYSPVELKFSIDFEQIYNKSILDKAAIVAKVLTRQWDRNNTDVLWGRGVFDALLYGAAVLKQWVQAEGADHHAAYYSKLVMPWQFGVYNESENDINRQPALCETNLLTVPEIWRRIWHLPDAKKLLERVRTHAQRGEAMSDPQSYFHQVLSTSQLNTGVQGMTRPLPGGIVQLNNDPNYAIMGPQVAAEVVKVHELWVQGETDYKTLILVEPDILLTRDKLVNLLVKDSGLQPYRLIQPNQVTNWFWGRSELVDLIEPQALLATTLDDYKRLMGLQVDKILAFVGENNVTDEEYAQFRGAGYFNLPTNSKIEDITPKLPDGIIEYIKFLIEQINIQAGFPPIMQGQGDSGVRAGSHANTLLKTGSPTLRDRSLLVERQLADAADLSLAIREAKDPTKYWLKADEPVRDVDETSFMLTDLPDDWRVTVDSHSSSPIFADENTQLVLAAHKLQIVDGDYVIDNTALPNKENAKVSLRQRQERAAKEKQMIIQQHPEIGEKLLAKEVTGGKR